jgi:hypothetical protein
MSASSPGRRSRVPLNRLIAELGDDLPSRARGVLLDRANLILDGLIAAANAAVERHPTTGRRGIVVRHVVLFSFFVIGIRAGRQCAGDEVQSGSGFVSRRMTGSYVTPSRTSVGTRHGEKQTGHNGSPGSPLTGSNLTTRSAPQLPGQWRPRSTWCGSNNSSERRQ